MLDVAAAMRVFSDTIVVVFTRRQLPLQRAVVATI